MPKKYRLSHADFVQLSRSRSQKVHGAYFSLATSPTRGVTWPKMASVVSKKIAVRAVDRNRIERRCREALRPHMAHIPPVALVFYAKREAVSASFAQIKDDIDDLVARAGHSITRVA